MDNVMKLIIIGVGLILTSVVIFAAVNLTNLGTTTSRGFADSINDKNVAIENAEFTQYESVVCTGSDVVTAIRKYKNDMTIIVHGYSASGSTFILDSSTLSTFQNYPTNSNYVNPSAEFNCTLTKSDNGNVVGMEFTQIEYVSPYVPTSYSSYSLSEEATPVPVTNQVLTTNQVLPTKIPNDEVEIIFSAGDKKLENTNNSIVAEDFAKTIAMCASNLDDVVTSLENFDLESDGESKLNNAYTKLVNLELEIVFIKEKCKEGDEGSEEIAKVREQLKSVVKRIEQAKVSIESLKKQLKAAENTDSLWWIGFPVSVGVKAELKDGVLTLEGEGEISLERGEIPWLKKAESIERVEVEEGVLVDNIDYWFSGCSKLREVKGLPETVSSANGAFEGCTALEEVKLPSGIVAANGIGEGTVFCVPEDSETQKTFEKLSEVSDVVWR